MQREPVLTAPLKVHILAFKIEKNRGATVSRARKNSQTVERCRPGAVVSLPHTKKVEEESDKLRFCIHFTEYCCTKVARFTI